MRFFEIFLRKFLENAFELLCRCQLENPKQKTTKLPKNCNKCNKTKTKHLGKNNYKTIRLQLDCLPTVYEFLTNLFNMEYSAESEEPGKYSINI